MRPASPRCPSIRVKTTGSGTPGFFILDSTTGAIESGLSREGWLKKLQKAGIQGEPELVYPVSKGPRF